MALSFFILVATSKSMNSLYTATCDQNQMTCTAYTDQYWMNCDVAWPTQAFLKLDIKGEGHGKNS